MTPDERMAMKLQMAAALCLAASLAHLLGGTLYFLLVAGGYLFSAVGLFRRQRWAVRLARAWAVFNGCVNVGMLGYVALLYLSDRASPRAGGAAISNTTWLLANIGVLWSLSGAAGNASPAAPTRPTM